MVHRFIYLCFSTVSITGRRVAQKPEIHEDFPGNFTQVVGSEVLLECPIVVNDSFDPPEMLWIEVNLHTIQGQPTQTGFFELALMACLQIRP